MNTISCTIVTELKEYEPSEAFKSFSKENIEVCICKQMDKVREIISRGLGKRGIKLRQPLASASIYTLNPYWFKYWAKDFLDEWNVEHLNILDQRCFTSNYITPDPIEFDTKITPLLAEKGWIAELKRNIQNQRKLLKLKSEEVYKANLSEHPIIAKYLNEICSYTNIVIDDSVPLNIKIKVNNDEIQLGIGV